MAILKIARMGHPVLRGKAEEVADPTAPEIRQLVADMVETMEDADGTGLEPLDQEQELGWEGCLSVPGLRGAVPRFVKIRYRGLDLFGKPIDRVAEGFHARVLQHECDHLDGVLYPQRMTDLSLLVYLEEGARHPIDLGQAGAKAAE